MGLSRRDVERGSSICQYCSPELYKVKQKRDAILRSLLRERIRMLEELRSKGPK